MGATDYGLGDVENLQRSVERPKQTLPAGSEPCGSDDTADTDTDDTETEAATNPPSALGDMPLGQAAEAAKAGDPALEETLRRIAPHDGSRILLVAASFNSAI